MMSIDTAEDRRPYHSLVVLEWNVLGRILLCILLTQSKVDQVNPSPALVHLLSLDHEVAGLDISIQIADLV